jgi:hypothetical protein
VEKLKKRQPAGQKAQKACREAKVFQQTRLFSLVMAKRDKVDTTMTAETNEVVMRRFLKFINSASETLAQELISPDAVFHVPGRPEKCAARLATSQSSV